MNEKHVLLIIPNLGRGGAQQVFRDQLHFYSSHHHTTGCVFNWDDSFKDDHKQNMISLGVPAGKNWLSKIYYFWKRVYVLKKIKKAYQIDFSISHLEGADYVNLFSKGNEKVICWIHGTKTFDQNIEGILGSIRKKILIPFTYKISNLVITVSEGIRQELIKNFNISERKVKTVYNGFDLEEISLKALEKIDPSREELFSTKTVLITHCRLSRQKNLVILLDIFNQLKTLPNIKLVILGDGELRNELVAYGRTLNLSVYSIWNATLTFNLNYDIYFLGYERNPYPFLHRATLYIMTSSWEGFPLSLCEAMASGVPVMTTDCYTGPREIITPDLNKNQPINEPEISQCGVLMPLADKNIDIWSNTIISILNNPELRNQFVKKGNERVQRFDKRVITSQWLTILQ